MHLTVRSRALSKVFSNLMPVSAVRPEIPELGHLVTIQFCHLEGSGTDIEQDIFENSKSPYSCVRSMDFKNMSSYSHCS